MRNYIRRKAWSAVKFLHRMNSKVGEIAITIFAIAYYEFEEPAPQVKMSAQDRRYKMREKDWEARRLDYFHGGPKPSKVPIHRYNVQESVYEGIR